jgi:hypothetical protein
MISFRNFIFLMTFLIVGATGSFGGAMEDSKEVFVDPQVQVNLYLKDIKTYTERLDKFMEQLCKNSLLRYQIQWFDSVSTCNTSFENIVTLVENVRKFLAENESLELKNVYIIFVLKIIDVLNKLEKTKSPFGKYFDGKRNVEMRELKKCICDWRMRLLLPEPVIIVEKVVEVKDGGPCEECLKNLKKEQFKQYLKTEEDEQVENKKEIITEFSKIIDKDSEYKKQVDGLDQQQGRFENRLKKRRQRILSQQGKGGQQRCQVDSGNQQFTVFTESDQQQDTETKSMQDFACQIEPDQQLEKTIEKQDQCCQTEEFDEQQQDAEENETTDQTTTRSTCNTESDLQKDTEGDETQKCSSGGGKKQNVVKSSQNFVQEEKDSKFLKRFSEYFYNNQKDNNLFKNFGKKNNKKGFTSKIETTGTEGSRDDGNEQSGYVTKFGKSKPWNNQFAN